MTGHAETKFCTISYTYKEKFSKKYTKECDKQKTKYREEIFKTTSGIIWVEKKISNIAINETTNTPLDTDLSIHHKI